MEEKKPRGTTREAKIQYIEESLQALPIDILDVMWRIVLYAESGIE